MTVIKEFRGWGLFVGFWTRKPAKRKSIEGSYARLSEPGLRRREERLRETWTDDPTYETLRRAGYSKQDIDNMIYPGKIWYVNKEDMVDKKEPKTWAEPTI